MNTAARNALAGAVLLLAAACAGEDPDSAPRGTTPQATAPELTSPDPTATGSTSTSAPPSATSSSSADITTSPPTTAAPTTAAPTTMAMPLDEITVEFRSLGEFEAPIDFEVDRDGERYVVERAGRVIRLDDRKVVLDISDDTKTESEQGLLAIAFHPEQPFAYVSYTNNDGDTRVDEYLLSDDGSFDTHREVLAIDQPFGNHNGGDIHFGPDGLLYIAMGDGGSGSDPDRRGLDTEDLLGKMLRIDPINVDKDKPYGIPFDNPFVNVEGAEEIWSVGLRNPWRFSFDRETGDLWIGDVGQGEWEEVDMVTAADGGGLGVSFGWSAYEGTHRFNDDQPEAGHTPPVYEYSHDDGNGSITGGYVYRGDAIAGLNGAYVFGDYSSGRVWALRLGDDDEVEQVELGTVDHLASFGEDADGELYAVSLDGDVSLIAPG